MKKLVISGSSKLHERALYWRGYFEGRGYDVIDWPAPISLEEETLDEPQTAPGLSLGRWLSSSDNDYAEHMFKIYQRFYKNLDQTDVFFLMNEDQNNLEGYIGPSVFSELSYVILGNLAHGKKVEIYLLQMPSKLQPCYQEIKFWLDQKLIKIYHRPTGKKATIPVAGARISAEHPPLKIEEDLPRPAAEPVKTLPTQNSVKPATVEPSTPHHSGLFGKSDEKSLDILFCNKKCVRLLSPAVREYLKMLSPEFPAWLLRYIAAPEVQRLADVSMACGLDYTSLCNYPTYHSTFEHSIGTALIVWHFTRDKKQTLAALFHDIASPAFKHVVDFLNDDSETQESTEARTGEIIRNSRIIMRNLKKDGILVSEVENYQLYPIADNDSPNLAADRLEYTFSNGLFLYGTWDLEQLRAFYQDLTIAKNENDIDELTFRTPSIAAEFTINNLPLSAEYHSERLRVTASFIADILRSMIKREYLTIDDLYSMSEREVIDWILSCGDHTIGDAFRQFQRATTVYSGANAKKGAYSVAVKPKIRYIVPLVLTSDLDIDSVPIARRITEVDDTANNAVESFLDEKIPKYVGFDFDFQPYTE